MGFGMEEEEFPTDFHGLVQIVGLRAPGYFFLLLSHPAVSLSGKKMKSAVPADWERIFTDEKIVSRRP